MLRMRLCKALLLMPDAVRQTSYCASSSFYKSYFNEFYCNKTNTLACSLPMNYSAHFCDNRCDARPHEWTHNNINSHIRIKTPTSISRTQSPSISPGILMRILSHRNDTLVLNRRQHRLDVPGPSRPCTHDPTYCDSLIRASFVLHVRGDAQRRVSDIVIYIYVYADILTNHA